jgi:hypothetical protein
MASTQEHTAGLPVRHSLTLVYGLTFLMILLMAAASVAGLAYGTAIYPTDELRRDLGSLDVVSLSLGLPALLAAVWLTRRGHTVGLLCWPGALFFALYPHLIQVFAMPLNAASLLQLAPVTLGVYTLIGLVTSIDAPAVKERLSGGVPARIMGAVLAGQGLLNFGWAAAALVMVLAAETPAAEAALANHMTDVLVAPAWIVAGALLWRRQALGYVAGLGLLLQGSLLVLGATVLMLLRLISSSGPVALLNVGVMLAGGLVCFIPFWFYARACRQRGARRLPDAQIHSQRTMR